MESIFEELRESCVPPPARKRSGNAWISETTWALVDHRVQMANGGRLTRRGYHKLSRKVRASLKRDRQKRAHEAGTTMESHLESGELQEAWRTLKGWYRMAEDKAPQPCFATMEKQTREREELYERQVPPGDPIPINVEPFEIRDESPEDAEVREVVRNLRNGRAGGASKIRAEHIKDWLSGIVDEEENGNEGAGDRWRAFLKLIQAIWEQGCIPQQMQWVIVVLLPKGGGDFCGIGLLEPFWKVIDVLINGRMELIEFHDCLHGFLKG